MGRLANLFKDIRADRWNLRIFTLISGLVAGLLALLVQPSVNMGPIINFLLYFVVAAYLTFLFLGGNVILIRSVFVKSLTQKLASNKAFNIWLVCFVMLAFVGIIATLVLQSGILLLIWLYSMIGAMTIYPCMASLAVYTQTFRYLKYSEDAEDKKKNLMKSLLLATIGLATPLMLAQFFIIAYLGLPSWFYYIIVVATYLGVFFIAIDWPYYQSMEAIKQRKLGELQVKRQSLIDSINGNNTHIHVAIELNIQRIDRDIQTVSGKSSHPYSIIKSTGAFVVVVILGGMLANVLGELAKVILNIG